MAKRFASLQSSRHTPCAVRPSAPSDGKHQSEADGTRSVPATLADGTRSVPATLTPVGVLLPGSVAADIVFFGLHLAGKLPVLLNWTTGPGQHGPRSQDAGHSPRHHLQETDRPARHPDRRGRVPCFWRMFARASASWKRRWPCFPPTCCPAGCCTVCRNRTSTPRRWSSLLRVRRARPRPCRSRIATWLRTCGRRLMVLQASRSDVLLGFLPPFHSFGLLANVLAPVLGGIRVAHYPDPTDAAGLVRTVAAYKTTIVVTTPTFLSYMFGDGHARGLASLRIIVTGAEKCPEALFERAKQMVPHAFIWRATALRNVRRSWRAICRGSSSWGPSGRRSTAWRFVIVDPDSHQRLPRPGRPACCWSAGRRFSTAI